MGGFWICYTKRKPDSEKNDTKKSRIAIYFGSKAIFSRSSMEMWHRMVTCISNIYLLVALNIDNLDSRNFQI